MHALLPFASLAAAGPALFVGSWSPYTLLIFITMLFISLVLAVVLLVTGMSGGYAQNAPAEADTPPKPIARMFAEEAAALRAQQAAEAAKPEEPAPAQPAEPDASIMAEPATKPGLKAKWRPILKSGLATMRKNGLFYILCAILLTLPAGLALAIFENDAGVSVAFTTGTAFCLLCFGAQVWCIWKYRKTRRAFVQN